MISKAQRWLAQLPVHDPTERRQAMVFQLVLLGWIMLAGIGVPLNVILGGAQPPSDVPLPPLETLPPIFGVLFGLLGVAGTLLALVPVIAFVLLRLGRFKLSVAVAALGLLTAHSSATYVLGLTNGSVLVVFQIPIALAGLLGGRRLLIITTALSIVVVVLVGYLESLTPPMAGFFAAMMASAVDGEGANHLANQQMGQVVGFFVAVTLLVGLLLDRFSSVLREALDNALSRESELQNIRTALETTVEERTAALQAALDEARRRSDEQERLLRENEQQRLTIKDLTVPVIPISAGILVIPLVGALDQRRLQDLQEQSLKALERTGAHTLVLDITGVPVVDSYVAQGFLATVTSARLLGAKVILVGIRPEVAQTIVGLGIDLQGVLTYSDLQSALALVPSK